MKVERISPNKIKVTLTTEDKRKWNVDFNSLACNTVEAQAAYNSPETQELIWNIMKLAETEANFYAEGSHLIVEAMPPRNEAFVMIITKLDDDAPIQQRAEQFIKNRTRRSELRAKVKTPRTVRSPIIYEYASVDDLIDSINAISKRFLGISSIYCMGDKYYLALEIASPINGGDIEVILSDFAKRQDNAQLKMAMLNERAELIVKDNAIETFSASFN